MGLRGSVFITFEELEAAAGELSSSRRRKKWKDQNYISKISEKSQAKSRKCLDQDRPP
jgi:hypothetical protein